MCLFAPLKSSTAPDMKWVLLKCLLIELDTNEVMVPFKAQSGGRRQAVVGGGFLLPGVPTLPPPASCHTAAPPPPPQPQPAGLVTRRPARSPAQPRLPVANGCGQSLRGEPRGPGGAARARLELGHPEANGCPPAPRAARLTPRAGLPNLQALGASLPGPSSDWSCSPPQATRRSGPTVEPRGPSRPSPPHTSAQESGHLTCRPPTPTPGL